MLSQLIQINISLTLAEFVARLLFWSGMDDISACVLCATLIFVMSVWEKSILIVNVLKLKMKEKMGWNKSEIITYLIAAGN